MFYTTNKKQNLLKIDNNLYAKLLNIEINDDLTNYTFELTYQAAIKQIFQNNAFLVKIKVLSQVVPQYNIKNTIAGLHGNKQNQVLISQLQSQMMHIRTAQNQQAMYILAEKNSDITAYINNTEIQNLQQNTIRNSSLTKKRLVNKQIKELNEVSPIYSLFGFANLENEQNNTNNVLCQKLMLSMITNDGLDPSYITSMQHRSLTARQTTSGLIRKNRSAAYSTDVSYDKATQFLSSILYNTNVHDNNTAIVENSKIIQTLQTTTPTHYTIKEQITFNDSAFKNTNFNLLVQFELIDITTNLPISTEIKTLNLEKHITNFYIPTKPPIAFCTNSSDSSKVFLEIKAGDDKTQKIRILKKTLYTTKSTIDDYVIYGDFSLTKTLQIPITLPINSYLLYRIIPLGAENAIGSEYTNIVITPTKIYEIQSIAIATKIVENGIQLEARNIPPNATAIQFIRKNKTTNEQNWSNIGTTILINNTNRSTNVISIVDSNVKHQRIYEYATKIIFDNGLTSIAGSSIKEFIKQETGIVDTAITNLQIIQDDINNLNVVFNVETQLLDTGLDILHNLLKNNEIQDFFNEDITNEREMFKKLVAHLIVRTNLTTGEQESFDILIGNTFNDQQMRNQNSIKALKQNNSYRYEIYPAIRAPETLLENYNKTKIDNNTKKEYKYSPIKFYHPLTLSRGILLTQQGRKLLYTKSEIAHGTIGNLQTVNIIFDDKTIVASQLIVSRIDDETNKLQWKLNNISLVDHFLILKDSLGIRTFVGKSHSNFDSNEAFFIHKLSQDDKGSFKYIIIPVLNTYKLGSQIVSNTIEVI